MSSTQENEKDRTRTHTDSGVRPTAGSSIWHHNIIIVYFRL